MSTNDVMMAGALNVLLKVLKIDPDAAKAQFENVIGGIDGAVRNIGEIRELIAGQSAVIDALRAEIRSLSLRLASLEPGSSLSLRLASPERGGLERGFDDGHAVSANGHDPGEAAGHGDDPA